MGQAIDYRSDIFTIISRKKKIDTATEKVVMKMIHMLGSCKAARGKNSMFLSRI